MPGFVIKYNQAQFARLKGKLSGDEVARLNRQTIEDVAGFIKDKISEYPPEKRVTRRQAYGVTFSSDKQRRWFWAALNSGELQLPYQRTNTLKQGWQIGSMGGSQLKVTNDVAYAGLVQERGKQSRMMKLIGWHTVSYWLQKYGSEIGRVALRNIRRWTQTWGAG